MNNFCLFHHFKIKCEKDATLKPEFYDLTNVNLFLYQLLFIACYISGMMLDSVPKINL